MIQVFKNSLNLIEKQKLHTYILLLVFSFILGISFSQYLINNENSLNVLLNNTLQFSGIFAAILITFIITKTFQIRSERLTQFDKIVVLSNKVTHFRKIARILVQCYGFWNKEMIDKMEKEYKSITFFSMDEEFSNPNPNLEFRQLIEKYTNDNLPGKTLYLDMKSLFLDDETDSSQLYLYQYRDDNITYDLNILQFWRDNHSGNQLWHCFDHRWVNFKTAFNLAAIRKNDQDIILELCNVIDPIKFRNKTFDKDLLAEIGSDVANYYIPELYAISFSNSRKLSASMNFLIFILILTITSGVLSPLFISTIHINIGVKIIIAALSSGILILSLLFFLLKFKSIINQEIKVN